MEKDKEKFLDELDELVQEMSNNPINSNQSNQIAVTCQPKKMESDEIILDYVDNNIQKVNDIVTQLLVQYANNINGDAERLDAYSNLIDKHSNLLKLLNDRVIKSKDNKTKILIQKMKNEKDLIKDDLKDGKDVITNREHLFDALFEEAKKVSIDAEFEEIESE